MILKLNGAVLTQLTEVCGDNELLNIFLRKFINLSDLKFLENRLAGCYEAIEKSTGQTKILHIQNRLTIEEELEAANRRSKQIDNQLDPILKALPEDKLKLYETLLEEVN